MGANKIIKLGILIGVILYSLTSCHSEERNHSYSEVPDSNISKGRELAKIYCQSCHALPDPSLADATTWFSGILPQMAPRLGIFRYNNLNYPSKRFDKNIPKNFYPENPVITLTEWQYIIDYYCSLSPDSLPKQHRSVEIEKDNPFFEVLEPALQTTTPATVLVKIGKEFPGSAFIVSDAITHKITGYDSLMHVTDSVQLRGPAVGQISTGPDRWVVCDIGILNPNDGQNGKLLSIKTLSKNSKDSIRILYDSLRRPVQVLEADLNKDGRTDLLVCEFGNLLGALSWYEQKADGNYMRHVLQALPGAIHAEITDYNHDGLPDIWCLFAQGDEMIRLYTNKGNGQFSGETILRFPPIYGSSYFELDDFNGDGFPDILYTCGDNADYSTVLKPYHGVYIFLNDRSNHFTQKYFFPVNGCYKAMAKDFDGDGDLDIASISYFPDFYRQPEESFVYFENKGNFSFLPYSFPKAAEGRWLTMDVGDIDGNGKPDIILGNLSIAPSFITVHADWQKGPSFLILKNITHR